MEPVRLTSEHAARALESLDPYLAGPDEPVRLTRGQHSVAVRPLLPQRALYEVTYCLDDEAVDVAYFRTDDDLLFAVSDWLAQSPTYVFAARYPGTLSGCGRCPACRNRAAGRCDCGSPVMRSAVIDKAVVARVARALRINDPIDISFNDELPGGVAGQCVHETPWDRYHTIHVQRGRCRRCTAKTILHEVRHAFQWERLRERGHNMPAVYNDLEDRYGYAHNPLENDADEFASANVGEYMAVVA